MHLSCLVRLHILVNDLVCRCSQRYIILHHAFAVPPTGLATPLVLVVFFLNICNFLVQKVVRQRNIVLSFSSADRCDICLAGQLAAQWVVGAFDRVEYIVGRLAFAVLFAKDSLFVLDRHEKVFCWVALWSNTWNKILSLVCVVLFGHQLRVDGPHVFAAPLLTSG